MAYNFTAPDMEAIRAKLAQEKNKGGDTGSGGGDNAMYPFWNGKIGESVTLRLLPDGNPDNTLPFVQKLTIKLPFEGVVGGENPTNKKVFISVPCMDMYGKGQCAITQHIRPWWNQKGQPPNPMHSTAQTYYRKQSWLYQGLVVDSPIVEENVPENPIRRLMFNFQVHQIVETTLMDPKVKNNPTDPLAGRDLIIRKTKQGEYDNYSTSGWDMDARSLSEKEMAAIEKYGLFRLDEFIGRKPGEDELKAIYAMFLDSLAGRPFDMASYGAFYRPFVKDSDRASPGAGAGASTAAPLNYSRPAVTESAEAATPPAASETPASGAAPQSVDIMEKIRRMREAQQAK